MNAMHASALHLVHDDASLLAAPIAHVQSVEHHGDALQVVALLCDGRTLGIDLAPGRPPLIGEVCA